MDKYQKRLVTLGKSSFTIGVLVIIFALLRFDIISIAVGIIFIIIGRSIKNNPTAERKTLVIIDTILALLLMLGVLYPLRLYANTDFAGVVLFVTLLRSILPLILLIEGLIGWHAVTVMAKGGNQMPMGPTQ